MSPELTLARAPVRGPALRPVISDGRTGANIGLGGTMQLCESMVADVCDRPSQQRMALTSDRNHGCARAS